MSELVDLTYQVDWRRSAGLAGEAGARGSGDEDEDKDANGV